MPIVNIPLPEVEQMVARPVIMAILEQVKQITNIPQDTEITFIGQNNSRLQFGHPTSPGTAPVKLASQHMVSVEVEEEPDEGMFATTPGNRHHNNLDFVDQSLGVVMKPIYCGMDLIVSVKFRTPSRTEAVRWRNDARYKASQMRSVNLHVVEYAYQLPKPFMVVLKHVHELREKNCGYGDSFEEYMTKHLTTRATQASTVVGTHPEIIIKEAQDRIQGTFDFTALPRKQDRNEGDGWEVEFTYTFSYHKPVEYSMTYPLLVHQQPIKYEYIPQLPASPYEHAKRMTKSMGAFHFMEAEVVHKRLTGYTPIHYHPEQDAWIADTLPQNKQIVASFMVSVKPDVPKQKMLNLKDLGGYYLDVDVREWMLKAEYPYLQIPGVSPVGVALYRNESLAHPKTIEVDKDGNVWLLQEADCRKRYRVVITMNDDLGKCHPGSLKRLSNFPEAMCKIIKFTKTTQGKLNGMLGYIDMGKFLYCAPKGGIDRESAIGLIVSMKTVMVAGVEAHRIENLN